MESDDIEAIIKRFGFIYEIENDAFHVGVPVERLDLRIKEDLIADLGRIYGYENIPTIAPEPLKRAIEVHKTFYYTDKIRGELQSKGFSEVYTSVFAKEGERAVLNKVESDTPYLRTSLAPSLEAALEMNFKNKELLGLDEVKLFEIGNVWSATEEKLYLALGIKGNKKSQKPAEALGELAEALGVAAQKGTDTGGVVELDLGALIEKLRQPKEYEKTSGIPQTRFKSFSRYPFALRDIALWVPEGTGASHVEGIITKNAGELLVTHKLFDEFKKDGRISYAFRLVFQSFDRTLSDEEVNKIMEKVVKELNGIKGFEVR